MKTIGFACTAADTPLEPFVFERRAPRADDVVIEILYCGVCHTDLHSARNDLNWTVYPTVPGHEIIGRVIEIGTAVKGFRPGDLAAVGCMVDSCQNCDQCNRGNEQMCREGFTFTSNSPDRVTGEITKGGYAKHIVVREDFVCAIPEGLDITRAAPLLCAGITAYSPLRAWNVGRGTRVGVIGLGGIGHLVVKFAAAMGANVTVLSRSASKAADIGRLGAQNLLISTDPKQMEAAQANFDLIIDTIPSFHDLTPYLPLLDIDGTLVVVGHVGIMERFNTFPLIAGRRRIAGSVIGGIAETAEMLAFCAENDVMPDVEVIPIDAINNAFERMEHGDVRYRFVIDMASFAVVSQP